MPRSYPTTSKNKKEYAQEVAIVARRTRTGRLKHWTIAVTPSSSHFTSSPAQPSATENLTALPALSFNLPDNSSVAQESVLMDNTDYSMEREASPDPIGRPKSRYQTKVHSCLMFPCGSLILTFLNNRRKMTFSLTGFLIAAITCTGC